MYSKSSLYGTSLSDKFTVTVFGNYYRDSIYTKKNSHTVSAGVLFTPYRSATTRISFFLCFPMNTSEILTACFLWILLSPRTVTHP
ncbi:hypothetical protein E2C01_017495 [Portunus trituberculatus]|uniref:Uncharacterized protein n=1 Tax=Portunus trituberculatus TaxID=210409 RepID=A0A5B7DTM7_PORTR|nr:hypothetical protein [Portunus trituberculatus]